MLSRSVVSEQSVSATLWTVALQAPLSMEFSRQEYWSGSPCPLPGDLLNPGMEPSSPTLQVDSLSPELPENPLKLYIVCYQIFKPMEIGSYLLPNNAILSFTLRQVTGKYILKWKENLFPLKKSSLVLVPNPSQSWGVYNILSNSGLMFWPVIDWQFLCIQTAHVQLPSLSCLLLPPCGRIGKLTQSAWTSCFHLVCLLHKLIIA